MARNTYKEDERLEEAFNIKHLFRAFKYIKKYRRQMLVALFISALGGMFGYLSPMIVRRALDVAVPDQNTAMLYQLAGMLAGVYIFSIAFSTIRSRLMINASQNIIYDIRKDLFAHLQELPFAYYDNRPHGKILIRVVNYVNSVSDMLSNGLINVVLEGFNLIVIIAFMFATDVELALVVMAGVPILAIFMFWIKNRQRKAWQAVSNKNSNLNAYLQENIVGARITQIFAREDENLEIFEGLSKDCKKTWLTAVKYSNLVWPGIDSISVCVRAAIFIFGLVIFGQGNKSLGTIVAISSYASFFWQPIMNLGNIFNNFINNIAYLERIFETMDEPVTVADKEGAVPLPEIKGDVAFENVSFSYDGETDILKDVSFSVKAGESVALVGPTGAGKSTIVNLISRFYEVQKGKVTIDGHDISDATLRSIRSQMGIMMQDSVIFTGTIEDNIRYGRLDADLEEIKIVSKIVCASDFISQLPGGYQTQLRERGTTLSEGQKQLICFARTLLSEPHILILDEATSSIDVKTEKALQRGLNAMMTGRTSFIIAHRLSTIMNCDKIMYIDDGQIKECGTHDELMKKQGYYYKLFTAQSM
ncbi:MAG: ABC transporter ATP-binding protein [Lachnospiraceae bacterium]|nr:ABC transporter ATP-binding protein [Lachnospiraceae bacterium]MBR4588959.1 ABC transporter ATP-binding protein [Lachnospiraceae bacterium]